MTNADLDTLWLMLCAIVVFFMQTGFTMLECGSCRSKNVVNIVFKNSMDACCAALTWWAVGWALAYGGDTVTGPRCRSPRCTTGVYDLHGLDKAEIGHGRELLTDCMITSTNNRQQESGMLCSVALQCCCVVTGTKLVAKSMLMW